MKKLKLNVLAFQKGEVLTRSQLKKVLGGSGSDDGSGGGPCYPPTPETCYNCCMAGWDSSTHTAEENENKVAACYIICPDPY